MGGPEAFALAGTPGAVMSRAAADLDDAVASDGRHLLGLEGMGRDEILDLLAAAAHERDWLAKGEPNRTSLAGVTVVLAFIEDSTRTRTSFEIAAQRLGANVVVFSSAASSLNKGETLLDTMRLFEAMGSALVVVRHPSSGVPVWLARHPSSGVPVWLARQLDRMGVINAGDGPHEHPTQALLDKGMTATDDATRAAAYEAVQAKVHDAAVWIPLFHEPLFVVTGAKLKPIKAHGNYGCGLYKGLGIAFK